MTSGQQDEAFFRERGFGLKIGFGARPALIIIDMIKAFTDPAMMLGSNLDQQIAATQPLLAAARERKIPTIFSTVMYNEADLADAGIWTLKQKGVVTLKAGTDLVDVDPRLDFGHRDILLVKKYASCFFGTDLVSKLVSRQVDTLIITGCTTSGCVRGSVVDGFAYNFRALVPHDAVYDRSQVSHAVNLFDMSEKYADVMSTDEALAALKSIDRAAA